MKTRKHICQTREVTKVAANEAGLEKGLGGKLAI